MSDVAAFLGCVVCGEPRTTGSPYCLRCHRLSCPDCGYVHTTRNGRCTPPPERNP